MKKSHIITALLILTALTFMSYWNVIDGEFQFDDENGIVLNNNIKNISTFAELSFFKSLIYSGRPLTEITFAFNYRYGRLDPRSYHITNIILHIIVAVLIFVFIRKTILLSGSNNLLFNNAVAMLSSFAFALHPLNTQAVSYISQRAEILSTLFYIITLLLFIKQNELRSMRNKLFLSIALALTFLCALGSKTSAISLPIMLVLYDYYFFQDRTSFERLMSSAPFIFGGIFFAIFYLMKLDTSQLVGLSIEGLSPLQYFLTQFKVVLTYIRLLFLPIAQNLDYEYTLGNISEIRTLLSIAMVLTIISLSIILRKKFPLISFGIAWFFVTLAPTSSFVPVIDIIVEHRTYLPSIGFFLLVSFIIFHAARYVSGRYNHKNLKIASIIVLLVIVSVLALATKMRNRVWESRISLWSDVVSKSPGKPRAHFNLGYALREKGLYSDAIRELETALACEDDGSVSRATIFRELGATYFSMGNIDAAISRYKEGLRLSPGHPGILNNLAIALMGKGLDDDALIYAEMALRIAPHNGDIHNSIGELYFRRGKYTEAAQHFIEAIRINPDVPSRYWNVALSLEKNGKIQEAVQFMENYLVLEKNPSNLSEGMDFLSSLRKKIPKNDF